MCFRLANRSARDINDKMQRRRSVQRLFRKVFRRESTHGNEDAPGDEETNGSVGAPYICDDPSNSDSFVTAPSYFSDIEIEERDEPGVQAGTEGGVDCCHAKNLTCHMKGNLDGLISDDSIDSAIATIWSKEPYSVIDSYVEAESEDTSAYSVRSLKTATISRSENDESESAEENMVSSRKCGLDWMEPNGVMLRLLYLAGEDEIAAEQGGYSNGRERLNEKGSPTNGSAILREESLSVGVIENSLDIVCPISQGTADSRTHRRYNGGMHNRIRSIIEARRSWKNIFWFFPTTPLLIYDGPVQYHDPSSFIRAFLDAYQEALEVTEQEKRA